MCQIAISEKSIPEHIDSWLKSTDHEKKEIVLMGDPSDPVVQQCLQMARDTGLVVPN